MSLDHSFISELKEMPHNNHTILNPESLSEQFKQGIPSSIHQESIMEPLPVPLPVHNHSMTVSESYLNISFEDILRLIFNNESPQLINSLHRCIHRSHFMINQLTVFVFLQVVAEFVALYLAVDSQELLKELLAVYYCFKLLSDGLLLYSLLQMRYTILDANQISQGDVSHSVIEYLKHIIKNNSPLDEAFEEENLTQAQQVANILSTKITTWNWLDYLMNHKNAHTFSINRIVLLSQIMIFVWGNVAFIQWADLNWMPTTDAWMIVQCILNIFSMSLGYLVLLGLLCTVVIVCAGIPVLICLVLWQSCSWFSNTYSAIQQYCVQMQRQRFLDSLEVHSYSAQKLQDHNIAEECVICLQNYIADDACVKLPCNVQAHSGRINHLFHEECIRVWLEECGSCPICRTRFVARIE